MRKLLISIAGVIALTLTFQPRTSSACCGVVGADGYTRTWWRGTDGSISLWKLDSSFNAAGSHNYGPYVGWSPISLTIVGNTSYLLWRYTDGTALIWELDANLNYITSSSFGPVTGWIAEGLGIDGKGNIRLVWHTPSNMVAAWVINTSLVTIGSSPVYGPYFGWLY